MQTIESNIKGVSTSNTSGGGISNVMSVDGGDAEIGQLPPVVMPLSVKNVVSSPPEEPVSSEE
jgi:hypothetical protein